MSNLTMDLFRDPEEPAIAAVFFVRKRYAQVLNHGDIGRRRKNMVDFPQPKIALRMRGCQAFLDCTINGNRAFYHPKSSSRCSQMQSRLLEIPQHLERQLRHQAALFVISLSVSLEREIDNNQPIAFVVHSLGGVIVKDAIHRSGKIRERMKLIIFLGTPHRRSAYASWRQIASNLTRVALQDSNKKLLEALEVNNEVLDNIDEESKTIVFKG
ncbi:hypothetical protein P3342_004733 [Pyrenophora teres f. teres]|nr:hypothetical protein P3342_004733 [Pyrenophora teres f. teres]